MLGVLHDAARLEIPAQSFAREDDVDWGTGFFCRDGAIFKRHADREFTGARLAARLAARMRVLRDVVVKRVHELPRFRVAPHLYPSGDIEIARTRGRGIGHDNLAFVYRLGQVLPRLGLRQVLLRCFDRIETDRGAVDIHADPLRRIPRIAIRGHDLVETLRRIRLKHAFVGKYGKAGRRRSHKPDSSTTIPIFRTAIMFERQRACVGNAALMKNAGCWSIANDIDGIFPP